MREEIITTLKSNWLLLTISVVLIIGMIIFWFNSPLWQEYKESRRTDAIKTLALNYNVLPSEALNDIKIKYNITDSEIEKYTTVTNLEYFIDGGALDSGVMEDDFSPFAMLVKVDTILTVALVAGGFLFVYKSFRLRDKFKGLIGRYEKDN